MRRAITSGELKPGQQLVQDVIAAELGVSRVPVREAMRALESEGHITHVPHRGYFVADLSAEDLREITKIRDLLEGEAIRSAVPALTDEHIEQLQHACDQVAQCATAGDYRAMTEANRVFHFTLLEAADMPRTIRILRNMWDATELYHSLYFADTKHRAQVNREHKAILAAARKRDTETLVRLLAEHRQHAIAAVDAVIHAEDHREVGSPDR
jgi:DNA-binding GntR family transcriptional regulator